ncbi:uncharacterized protein LOC113351675 [Papaver somniferum]|uniref:uncharacterized protein LOC113351675 n=1 Tax=Papaver somniferum TaxID=3469 RepID=UPI000E6F53A1|nr:uncharacterized protein LOC113351675 [Papaver somniferum]
MESHQEHLQLTLKTLKENQLFANLNKYSFGQGKLECLGHIISGEWVVADPSKIECMTRWHVPATIKDLRGFLGLTGYYTKFVRNNGFIARPLTELLKKIRFEWSTTTQEAFYKLKRAGSHNYTCLGVGAVLMQEGRVITFFSKGMGPRFLAMSTYEKELMEVVMAPLPIPEQAWEHISMDFILGLPKSKGREVILVIVDKFTKFRHFIALIHPYTAASVAKVFIDTVFKLYGLPKSIVSDRYVVFVRNFWQALFSRLGTSLHLSSAYHPQTDGQTERVNDCLETYLRCMTNFKPSKWVTWLPMAKWWYNTSYHTILKLSPFEALFGYAPPQFGISSGAQGVSSAVDNYIEHRQAMKLYSRSLLKKLNT